MVILFSRLMSFFNLAVQFQCSCLVNTRSNRIPRPVTEQEYCTGQDTPVSEIYRVNERTNGKETRKQVVVVCMRRCGKHCQHARRGSQRYDLPRNSIFEAMDGEEETGHSLAVRYITRRWPFRRSSSGCIQKYTSYLYYLISVNFQMNTVCKSNHIIPQRIIKSELELFEVILETDKTIKYQNYYVLRWPT